MNRIQDVRLPYSAMPHPLGRFSKLCPLQNGYGPDQGGVGKISPELSEKLHPYGIGIIFVKLPSS